MTTNVCSTRGRVSKRTVPAHEALSGPLQAEETKKIARVLSHRPGIRDLELEIVMGGDSICIATLYNPKLSLKNILLKSAVWAVKHKGREIIKLLPKAVIRICWMDGKSNAADSTSKLMFDNISIINSRMYRHGPDNLHRNCE